MSTLRQSRQHARKRSPGLAWYSELVDKGRHAFQGAVLGLGLYAVDFLVPTYLTDASGSSVVGTADYLAFLLSAVVLVLSTATGQRLGDAQRLRACGWFWLPETRGI